MKLRKGWRWAFWPGFLLVAACLIVPWGFRRQQTAQLRHSAMQLAHHFEPFSQTNWSVNHPGEGRQDFGAFQSGCPLEADDPESPICILPLGAMTPPEHEVMRKTAEYLGLFYNRPVKTLHADPLDDLPARARRVHPEWGNGQYLAGYLLSNHVETAAPKEAVATLGFTMTDLWPGGGWNFVFGLARLGNRAGVHSLHRYGNANGTDRERRDLLLRSLKIATHETGHMFGLPHCIAFHCAMNGTNGTEDTDKAPLMFCPECLQKVWWANGIQPVEWFTSLEKFMRREQLVAEADQCATLLDDLR